MVLYNLARMRASKEYNQQFAGIKMLEMVEKYEMESTLAEQDWFTLLGWEKPDLFHPLPCEYNVQTDTEYKTRQLINLWEKYRDCQGKHKIIHFNGSI